MAEKTIKHASFWYVNDKGVNQTALRGDTVDIPGDDDIERGERLGAFATDEDLKAGAPLADLVAHRRAEAGQVTDAGTPDSVEQPPAVEQPGKNDSREKWVEFARSKNAPDDELAPLDQGGLSRDRLREKYGA